MTSKQTVIATASLIKSTPMPISTTIITSQLPNDKLNLVQYLLKEAGIGIHFSFSIPIFYFYLKSTGSSFFSDLTELKDINFVEKAIGLEAWLLAQTLFKEVEKNSKNIQVHMFQQSSNNYIF